ncbi:MAG: hypothetical protein EOR12_09130 [Mesorhizobium sp.]|uniref:hypothetical protein n=1 Tax=Mesorhizobium sp. TaxID=1871066 RepID=UPI000FE6E367|nr:hypothetical protein [Mesorhizobium sp.]RWP90639.1 MAG: hypothetical protein EOR12_09130 [Mesorhizobium sp.]
MSVQRVRVAIGQFLASDDAQQILCIRGKWGTGKTYTWDTVLSMAVRDKTLKLKRYAKVSLFGLNSIQDIKRELFQSTVPIEKIGKPFNINDYGDYINEAKSSNVVWKLFASLTGNVSEAAVEAAALSIRNQLILVDDLERKGDGLRSVDVLGYISQLRDDRKCKVVLILNDEQLDDKVEFESYLEKVADVYLRFDPSCTEIADIAIPEGGDNIAAMVRKDAVLLGIKNVRVIKKVLALAKQIAPMLSKYSFSVTIDAVRTITILGWSYLQPNDAPPLEYLKRVDTYGPKKEDTDLDLKWRDLLLQYGYTNTTAFDLTLLEGVENGYFEQSLLETHAKALNEADMHHKAQRAMRELWDDLHLSFTKPAEPILDRFVEVFASQVQFLSLGDLANVERTFRELGDVRSEELVELYIRERKDDPSAFDTDRLYEFGRELPPELFKRIKEAENATKPKRTADETVMALAKNITDSELLAEAAAIDVGDYLQILKSHEGEELKDILTGLRRYMNLIDATPEMIEVLTRFAKAVKEIGGESTINQYRTRDLGFIKWLEKGKLMEEGA